MKDITVSDIRDLIITGSYMLGDGSKEPLDWKDYANKLENYLVSNNGVLITGKQCDLNKCDRVLTLVKHKENLLIEIDRIKQILIDNGLAKSPIHIDV